MQDFLTKLAGINDAVNGFVWVTIGIWILFGTGILTTFVTGFFQVSRFGHWIRNTIGNVFNRHITSHTGEKASISQFQALCTALAATVGVGNIAGVATAIATGGPGAIFWMWLAAFFGMMTNYSENILGIYYRRKNANGEWTGGAMYYLQDGLGSKKNCKVLGRVLAILFSALTVLASFGIGNLSQTNSIVNNIASFVEIKSLAAIPVGNANLYMLLIGVVLMALAALVVIGGLKRIASVTEKLVPFMIVIYIIGSLTIIGINFKNIGPAFASIFKFAFGIKAVAGGAAGVVIKTVVTQGFKRGIFSNEAGLGSSVMVHSASNVHEPVMQGMWGIFEVFADTIIICSMTALVVLTSGMVDLNTGLMLTSASQVTLVSEAFGNVFGGVGRGFIALAVLMFAFSTILGWNYYGSKAWEYLFGTKSTGIYRVVFVLVIALGAIMTDSLAWDISDTFNGMMMIPNLIGVITLSGTVFKLTKNYVDRRIRNLEIEPMLSAFPEIQKAQQEAMEKDGHM